MHHRRHLHFTSSDGSTFLAFFGLFSAFCVLKQCIYLKTKSSGIVLTPWTMFVPISTFLLLLISQVVPRIMCSFLAFFDLFWWFFTDIANIKKLFPKIYSVHIISEA